MKTLAIRLTGPLQAYGNEATFTRRTSDDHPSKSAIIGLLGAALGYRREDPRLLTLNQLAFAVRIDQPGEMMTEFQTVEWKPGRASKLSYRDLIQDAVFVVAIGSDDEALIARLADALRHPKFALFLGRRANVPAGVLDVQLIDAQDPVAVLTTWPWQASLWYQKRKRADETIELELYADAQLLEKGPTHLVKDQVESFDQRDRRSSFRSVRTLSVPVTNPVHPLPETIHDIWSRV
ncbi:type I-E CRISPR-associated protein Cas5/CasD [Lacticaseibacillus absianus]|uniref:type I-E CRISPR-associated protein Cas5/CasD n=1 Tax=Lacticaseibacillus absianus TaxID=2729623 RepID=UPI0015CDEE04|nr:type I-E CRISPR-associated protein Cas5/CasD [Lacticaseibacillus absianus]